MMVSTFKSRLVILGLLCLLAVQTAWGEEVPQQNACECNCAELQATHDKCVSDFWAKEEERKQEAARVQTVWDEANQNCQRQLEEVRGSGAAQVEQATSELQARLQEVEQGRSQLMAQLEEVQQKSQADLNQCQSHREELNAKVEKVDNDHRRLQETSQGLQEELENAKSAKKKLQSDLTGSKEELAKAGRKLKSAQRELDETKKKLAEMEASRTIITIDFDLLNQRLNEIKEIGIEHGKHGMEFVAEKSQLAKEKAIECWEFLEREVFPEVERFVKDDAIPFVKKTWKQTCDFWEQVYAPYRKPVNKQIKQIKKQWNQFYKDNLESHVKQHKLDEHAAVAQAKAVEAKEMAQEYAALAHQHLVEGVKSSTGIALNFVKLEDGPKFMIDGLEKLHSNYENVAYYIELLSGAVFGYFVVRFLFFRKKKKAKKPKKTKKQWEEEQRAMKQQVNAQKNGTKLGKKKQK